MIVAPDLLKSIAPQAKAPELLAPALQAAAEKYDINTPQRLAMWLAQLPVALPYLQPATLTQPERVLDHHSQTQQNGG